MMMLTMDQENEKSMNENIIVVENLSYYYPVSKAPVLNEINLKIRKGQFIGVIGPTGAGKTTLCLALNGVVPQFFGGRFFGSVTVHGLDTVDHPISLLSRHVGSVFEDPETQLVTSSVEKEIAFPMENFCFPKEDILNRISEILATVRLEGLENKHPQELSGGQKQRLAIAAALAYQPDVLVLDEPTSQLDPIGSEEVFSVATELNKYLGVTVIMVSHATEELAEYADRLVFISDGKVLKSGSPNMIFNDAEYLMARSIRPPQVTTTFYLLREKGIKFNKIPIKLKEGLISIEPIAREYDVSIPEFNYSKGAEKQQTTFSVKNLSYVYEDGTQAIDNVSLDINKGEYLLIIGQNGAGKSTLVKHFLKLLEPTRGSVKVDGVETRELSVSSLASRIGYIAQNPDNQIFNTTVSAEVSFALQNLGFNKEEIENRTEKCLDLMGLTNNRDDHPLSLAKGDRARVVIAAILAMEPEIIIFDEPTTGQDYRGAQYILEISKKLHSIGKTIIVITHHLYLMPNYAERVVVMGKGTILLDAPIREAYHKKDVLESTYLTPPQAVFLAKRISEVKGKNLPFLTPEEIADNINNSLL